MFNGKRRFLLRCFMLITSAFLISNIGIPGSGLIVSFASAEIIYGGNVSGTWYEANSPYYVMDNVTIASNDTLTIEPGVSVYFMDAKQLEINGILNAVGTETDSISFNRDPSASFWCGLNFNAAQDYSHLAYCSIHGVGFLYGELYIWNGSDPIVSHCLISGDNAFMGHIQVYGDCNPDISDCTITGGQTGITHDGSCLTLTGCVISDFYDGHAIDNQGGDLALVDCLIGDVSNTEGTGPGAGILSEYSGNLALTGCTICNIVGWGAGAGVYCKNGTLTCSNCTFSNITAWNNASPLSGGGGICLDNPVSAAISYCAFDHDYCDPSGGAISAGNVDNLTIDHCTIDSCGVSGIWLRPNAATHITNTIISNNAIYNQGILTVEYTDFYNDGAYIAGNVPSGFGELSGVNFNGDSSDVYSNIFMDPLYVIPGSDYHLTAASPCIDAGDPFSSYDPDSTITDLGVYYFNQTGMSEEPSLFHITDRMLHISPCPCSGLLTISWEMPDNVQAGVRIYDLQGRLLRETNCVSGNVRYNTSSLPAGIYFCRLELGDNAETRPFVVCR